jgi:hypothetical protein
MAERGAGARTRRMAVMRSDISLSSVCQSASSRVLRSTVATSRAPAAALRVGRPQCGWQREGRRQAVCTAARPCSGNGGRERRNTFWELWSPLVFYFLHPHGVYNPSEGGRGGGGRTVQLRVRVHRAHDAFELRRDLRTTPASRAEPGAGMAEGAGFSAGSQVEVVEVWAHLDRGLGVADDDVQRSCGGGAERQAWEAWERAVHKPGGIGTRSGKARTRFIIASLSLAKGEEGRRKGEEGRAGEPMRSP